MFDKAVKVFDLTEVFAEWYPVIVKDLNNSVDSELTTTKGLRAAHEKYFPESKIEFWIEILGKKRRCPKAFITAMMQMCIRKQNEFGDLEDYKIIGDLIKKKNPPSLIYNYDNLKEYHLSSIQ